MSLDAKGAAALALHRFGFGPRAGLDRGDRVRSARRAARRTRPARHRPDRQRGADDGGAAAPRHSTSARSGRRARSRRSRRRPSAPRRHLQESMEAPADAPMPAPRRCRSRSSSRGQGALRRRARARDRLCRAAGLVLVEPFLRVGRQSARARSPARSSARRSARMCSAASSTCCSRSRRHPAMLIYLDNARSIGPNSLAGLRQHARPERESRARNPGAAYARRAQRSTRRTTSPVSPR